MEFTLIIFSLLCRLAPVQAASWIVTTCIEWAVTLLENEDHRAWLEENPKKRPVVRRLAGLCRGLA